MRRKNHGQSMVEYALGLGCVAALCMVALGQLGHISGDMINSVNGAINYNGGSGATTDTGRMINNSATPWNLN